MGKVRCAAHPRAIIHTAMITVANFFTRLTPKLHGTTLNRVSNKYELLEEAAANMLAEVDPPTVVRKARIANAIYDKVYNYTAPSDLADEGAILDLRPIGERYGSEATFVREFDRKKWWKDLLTVDVGALFNWLKFPDASRLNSVTMKWGSSSGIYWSKQVTAAQDRDFETDAWMLLKYDWSTASETGSPTTDDAEAIDYRPLTLNI